MKLYIKVIALFSVLFLPTAFEISSADSGSIQADAVVAISSKSETIFAKNADLRLPPASTTKLITAMVVLDRLSPEDIITATGNAAKTHTVLPRLRKEEKISVRGLLHVALMSSSNSAAVALAEGTAGSEAEFAVLMNMKAESIGALNSRFANASGLPGGEQYTTAYDLTLILKEALGYPLIKEILGKKEVEVQTSKRKIRVQNTDKLLWVTDNVVGGKTGYTCSAKHCFVGAVETEGGTVYTAVLGAPSRTALWLSTGTLMGIDKLDSMKRLVAVRKAKSKYARKTVLKTTKAKRPVAKAAYQKKKNKPAVVKAAKKVRPSPKRAAVKYVNGSSALKKSATKPL